MNSFSLRRFACCLFPCALLLFARPVIPQGNELVQMEPEKIRHLSGVVTDWSGAPVIGAIVQDCDSSFKNVLLTRNTDDKGRFSFPRAKRGTRHYLQVVYPGFNLTRISVTIDRDGENQLQVRLTVGT